MTSQEKTRENRLRRTLYRHGYRLMKQRRKAGYMIADVRTDRTVWGYEGKRLYTLTIDDVDAKVRELDHG